MFQHSDWRPVIFRAVPQMRSRCTCAEPPKACVGHHIPLVSSELLYIGAPENLIDKRLDICVQRVFGLSPEETFSSFA